jgi:hypothetical protein
MMNQSDNSGVLLGKKRNRKYEQVLLSKIEHLNEDLRVKESLGLGKLFTICHHCRMNKNRRNLVYWIGNDCRLTYCIKCIHQYSFPKYDFKIFSKPQSRSNVEYISENSEASTKHMNKPSNTQSHKYRQLKNKLGGFVHQCPVWTRKWMCQICQNFGIEQDLKRMKYLILNQSNKKDDTGEQLNLPIDEQMDTIRQNNWAIWSFNKYKFDITEFHQNEGYHSYNSFEIFKNNTRTKTNSAFTTNKPQNENKLFKTGERLSDAVNARVAKLCKDKVKYSHYEGDSTDDFEEGLSSVSIILPICAESKVSPKIKQIESLDWSELMHQRCVNEEEYMKQELYNSRLSGYSIVNKYYSSAAKDGPFTILRPTKTT